MAWTHADLLDAVRRYEQACIAAGCAQNTVDSYVNYARMFVDWRVGESHTQGAPGPRHPGGHAASIVELSTDVVTYRAEVRQAGKADRAVETYWVHASQFVRWLDGRFAPCASLRPGRGGRQTAGAGVGSAATARTPRASSRSADLAWAREASIQTAVVAWLAAAGWTIERAADTAAREHGPDIVATKTSRRLAVEAKGYPQATYESGEKAGEPKKWHPAAQARTYFGNAVHRALVMRDGMPGTEVAIALPDQPSNRTLVGQVRASLAELKIRVFLVGPDGSVTEPGRASA
jgi:hypothetical protein